MIARLRGKVWESGPASLVVDCNGVGYEVVVAAPTAVSTAIGQPVDLFVRQIVREDGVTLYGFEQEAERALFDLLREVKGCGPKISIAVIGTLGLDVATSAIKSQDSRQLALVSGIGARLAERIALELRDNIVLAHLTSGTTPSRFQADGSDEVAEALVALGYRRSEAEAASAGAKEAAPDTESRLRIALQAMRKA